MCIQQHNLNTIWVDIYVFVIVSACMAGDIIGSSIDLVELASTGV